MCASLIYIFYRTFWFWKFDGKLSFQGWNLIGLQTGENFFQYWNSVLKLIFLLNSLKTEIFKFFDRWPCSMLPWESNYVKLFKVFWVNEESHVLLQKKKEKKKKEWQKGEKKVMTLKGRVFWGACHSLHPRIFNSLKTPVLTGLITIT